MGVGRELEGRRKDGSTFPVEISLSGIDSPLGRVAVVFVSDITMRKRMEQALRRREREIRTVLDDNPDVIMRFDRQLRYTYVNAAVERVTHQPPEDFLGKTPVEMGRPRQMLDIWIPAMERTRDTGQPETVQFTFPRPGVGTEWELRIIPEFAPDGAVETLLVIGHDITERKRLVEIADAGREEIRALAASLLTAQEEERRRVSRELHDQICQQLAALAFDLGGFAAQPPRPAHARAQFRALQARAVKASEETRHIAYELHPSVLDDLGLETSLRDLCQRFSRKTGNIAVQFNSMKLPSPIPREIASCLYRIAQESLNNIAAHSGAKRASLELAAQDGTLRLTITDNGVGFDLSAARGQGGLGLISMEERSRMVNGKLTISTQPGSGTTIAVEVPLSSQK
jgi:PAS domain S-box-containing protein